MSGSWVRRFSLRIAGDAFALLPLNEARAAALLGPGRLRAFLAVELPHLIPAILTFLYCFMSFAVVLVLGGGTGIVAAGFTLGAPLIEALDEAFDKPAAALIF